MNSVQQTLQCFMITILVFWFQTPKNVLIISAIWCKINLKQKTPFLQTSFAKAYEKSYGKKRRLSALPFTLVVEKAVSAIQNILVVLGQNVCFYPTPVSYTQLTRPTKRIV